MTTEPLSSRPSGVALWRQVADALRQEIVAKRMQTGEPLPSETALAKRFGVNRHTVRAALKALGEEGVLRAEQGRGTFVQAGRRLSYRLSRRTRLSQSLSGQVSAPEVQLLSHATTEADEHVAGVLGLARGAKVLQLETLSRVDGRPLSRSTHCLEADRFTGIEQTLVQLGSITRAFAEAGIEDYVRTSTTISARPVDPDDAACLDLAPGAIVLVLEAVDQETSGTKLQWVSSRFPAARVELFVGPTEP